MDELVEKVVPIFRQYAFPLIIGIVGLLVFGYGVLSVFISSSKPDDIVFTSASGDKTSVKSAQTTELSANAKDTSIVVDIAGAVVKPGVYHLKVDARIQDAVRAAGGMSDDVDTELVAKQINLASRVSDGSKIYIPQIGDTSGASFVTASTSSGGTSQQININSATQSELDSLPGIGPVTADKIINNRPYGSLDDLVTKKSVTSSVFEKIKEKITY